MSENKESQRRRQPESRGPLRSPSDGDGRGAGRSTSSREKQEWIGRQLRSVYNEVVEEPVPDEFKYLLIELNSREKESS